MPDDEELPVGENTMFGMIWLSRKGDGNASLFATNPRSVH
jgi:hypothetical protein